MNLVLLLLIIGAVLVLWAGLDDSHDDEDAETWWYVEDEIDDERGFRR